MEMVDGNFRPTTPRRRTGMMSDPHSQNRSSGGKHRRAPPPAKTAKARPGRETSDQARERLLDEELDDTFPASDPPSWTMGGSVVSTRRH
jgi:hypothetical protein